MHIPDGFLNIATVATTYAASAGGISLAVRQTNKRLKEKHIPLMGVLAAFIFAAQMLNFPVAGATSGHIIGAALAAILLGHWSAALIMTCVLIAQSLIFQDGGLLALGANVLNMSIIASFSGYFIYRLGIRLFGEGKKPRMGAAFAGAWASVLMSALACAVELAVSGVSPLGVIVPAVTGVHAIIGIGEGLVTSAVLSLLMTVRVDLLELQKA